MTQSMSRQRVMGQLAIGLAMWIPWCIEAQPSPTAILDGLTPRAGRVIDFQARPFPDTVYVGEQLTYQVAVLLTPEVRQRLRRNPEFVPPAVQGMLAFELGRPREVPARQFATGVFEAFVFQRALFAVIPGRVVIPAPTLTYTLPQSASYFSREERVSLMADSLPVIVRPLPTTNQPADFLGAVGLIRTGMRVSAGTAEIGVPVVLTVRLEGSGNVRLWPRPVIEPANASVVANGERLRLDTAGSVVRGAKEFDYLVTPTAAGSLEIPTLRYPYFDPRRGVYEVAEAASLTIAVDGAEPVEEATDATIPLPSWRAWRQQEVQPLWQWGQRWRPALWVLALAPLLVLLARLWRTRRRVWFGSSAIGPAAPPTPVAPDAPGVERARYLRRRLLHAVSSALGLPPEAITDERDGTRALRRCGVTRETAVAVTAALSDLGSRAYARPGSAPEAAAWPDVDDLARRVSQEGVASGPARYASRGARARSWRGLLLGGVLWSAAEPVPVDRLVREAEAAFREQRYVVAAHQLADAVRQRPNDVDLLVNWGTAAWAAADTVAAVQGWQRAARLMPLDPEVQQRLRQLPSGARDGLAAVPQRAVPLLVLMAGGLWLLGWLVAWVALGRPMLRLLVAALLLASGASGFTAWRGWRMLDASTLWVVVRPETLQAVPMPGAEAMGGVGTGDVVRVTRAGDGWALVDHADGRRGWLPLPRITPLLPTAGNR